MQEVWVSFLGICTHIAPVQPNAPESSVWGHRVVLVNASNPQTIDSNPNLAGKGIEPHVGRMQIFDEHIVLPIRGDAPFYRYSDTLLLDLKGVTLQILNGSASGPEGLLSETGCLPGLSLWKPDVAPGPAVTDANPLLAACYFDYFAGNLVGTTVVQAKTGVAMLKIQTFGDPQLLITPFQGGSPTLVTLRNPNFDEQGNRRPVGINVMNLPAGPDKDNPNDFLLHYLAADGFPDGLGEFPPLTCPPNPFTYNLPAVVFADVGPGCSNSNLP